MPANGWTRRDFTQGLAGVAALAASGGKAESSCLPVRGVRWIVPNPPGGGFDTYSRLLAPYLSEELGLPVRVANEPGASGLRGLRLIRDARPDGGVIGLSNMPGALMMHEMGEFDVDPVRDLTVLGGVAHLSYCFAVTPDSPLRSIEDLIAAGPSGDLVLAIAETGGVNFLSAAITAELLGWKLRYVAGYSGSDARALAAMRGEVDLVTLAWDSLSERVRAGDLRPLAALDRADPEEYPELAAIPGLTDPDGPMPASAAGDAAALRRFMRVGRILVAPAGFEPPHERCLTEAVCRTLNNPEMIRQAAGQKSPVQPFCAETAAERVREAQDDIRRLTPLAKRVIREAGL